MLAYIIIHIHGYHIYIPGSQMTLVLIGKDLVLDQNRGQTGSRYIQYI